MCVCVCTGCQWGVFIGWMINDAEGKAGVDKRATINLQSLPIQGEFEEALGRISMGYNNILSKCTKYNVAHGANNIYNEDNGLLGVISGQAISKNAAPTPPEFVDHSILTSLLDPDTWVRPVTPVGNEYIHTYIHTYIHMIYHRYFVAPLLVMYIL